jgi:hypothetical protein
MRLESRDGEGHEGVAAGQNIREGSTLEFQSLHFWELCSCAYRAQIKSDLKGTQETLNAGTIVAGRDMSFKGWIALRNTECIC